MRTKRRTPARSGLFGWALFLGLLLAPAGYRFFELSRRGDAAPSGAALRETALALDRQALADALRQLEAEVAAAAGWRFDSSALEERGRFRGVLATVLPAGDPSPGRHALWVLVSSSSVPSPPPSHQAERLSESPVISENALVGCLRPLPLSERIARIQTLLDPDFRVKCRSGESLGILHGTGRRDPEGRPLLRPRHLSPLGNLAAGAAVVTAGNDGVYPAGIVIGWVSEAMRESDGVPLVRAAIDERDAREVVVLLDQARAELDRLGGALR